MSGGPDPKHEPPGESLADDLIGDDPEPEDGWIDVDDEGNEIPKPPSTPKP